MVHHPNFDEIMCVLKSEIRVRGATRGCSNGEDGRVDEENEKPRVEAPCSAFLLVVDHSETFEDLGTHPRQGHQGLQ